MTNRLFADRLENGKVIELPKYRGRDLGRIQVLDVSNPEQVLFQLVLLDSEGNFRTEDVWADREVDMDGQPLYRVRGWKVFVS